MELTFEEAFEYLTQITMTGNKKTTKTYHRVRFGKNEDKTIPEDAIPFDIYIVLRQGKNYKEKLKGEKIIIGNTTADLSDFFTEIEQRRTKCKEALIEEWRNQNTKAYLRRQ